MDMDMDVAWCMTCAKQTRDPRSPYCSDACRQADTLHLSSSTTPIPLTSPVPPIMTSPPIPSVESTSPLKMHLDKRPSITSLTPVRPASEIGSPTSSSQHLPLDRRAFSVPGMQALPPQSVMTEDRKPRQIGNVLPPFGRKSSIVTTSLNSPAFPVDPYPLTRSLAPGMGSANANCAKIPHFSDSVFCSTSERSDEEPEKPPVKLLSPIPPPARASNSTSIVHASPLPDDRRFPILRSQLHSAQSNAHLRNREASHLPVAATVASSASLRSREDIILWAKAVGMRLGKSSDDEEDQTRDRSRTGREPLRHLPPPSTELLDEHEEHKATGSGTYDAEGQSRLCAGRTGCEFYRPDRYASHERDEHCDFAQANPSAPPPPGLGLQSVRAPAEISRVAVVGTTLPGEDRHDAPAAQSFGGATPTLSTKSFTEAVDHLTGDDHDPVDIVLDDQSAESIGFAGRPMPLKPRRPSYSSTIRPPVPERRKHNSLPLHPNATTASSIWNLSASLHSFASFSIGSVIAPQSFFAAVDALDPALESSIPSLVHTPLQSAAPMPALRADSLTQETAPAAQDLIRSPSMDIIPRHNANGVEPRHPSSISSRRCRSREGRSWTSIGPTRDPRMRRDRSRSRSCSRSRGSVSRSRSSSVGIQMVPLSPHGRTWSYDAAQGEDGERRRGRSRVGKALGSPKTRSLSGSKGGGESGRGREEKGGRRYRA